MKTYLSGWLILLCLGCAHVGVEVAPGASSDVQQLANELAQLQLSPTTYQALVANVMKAKLGSVHGVQLPDVGALQPEVQDRLIAEVLEVLPDRVLVETMATLYAKYYSASELAELLRFYRSPTGKKTIAVAPLVGRDATVALLQHVKDDLPAAMLRMARQLLKDPAASPELLNWSAWTLATAQEATPAELEAAHTAAVQATAAEPENVSFTDTLATTEFRLGQFDQAVEHENLVYAVRRDDRATASQLARFEWARLGKQGVKVEGSDIETSAIQVTPLVPASGQLGRIRFLLTVGQALPKGGNLDVLYVSEGKPIGLVRFNLGPDHPASKEFELSLSASYLHGLPALKNGLPADTKTVLGFVNTWSPDKTGAINYRGKWMDAKIAELP